jgi:hypothetical protein
MALEYLKTDLDAQGHAVTVETAANPRDAVPLAQMTAAIPALAATPPADATKAAAVIGVGTTAARADHKHDVSTAAPSSTGTANTEGTSTALARADHVHQTSFAGVAAALAAATTDVSLNTHKLINLATATNPADAVPFAQMTSALATAVTTLEANGISTGAVQLSSLAFPASGAVICRVTDTVKDFFYLARSSTATADGITIVTALGGTGRWIRMIISDPSWWSATAWKISPSTGNDENVGDSGSPIKTRSEFYRRMKGATLANDVAVAIDASLVAGDTYLSTIFIPSPFSLTFVGTPSIVASGTVSAVVVNNGPSNITYKLTITPISGVIAGHAQAIIEKSDGSKRSVVIEDLSANQIHISPPISGQPYSAVDFVVNDVVNIYGLPSLGAAQPNPNVGTTLYRLLSATGAGWMLYGGRTDLESCSGNATCLAGQLNTSNIYGQLTIGGSGTAFINGGWQRIALVGGAGAVVNLTPVLQNGGGGLAANLNGTLICQTVASNVPHLEMFGGVILLGAGGRLVMDTSVIYGSTAGPTLFQMRDVGASAVLRQVPNVTGGTNILASLNGATTPVSVLATRQYDDVFGNVIIGPAGPTLNDNRSQPTANLGSGGATTTNAANIGDAQAIAAAAVAAVPSITSLTTDVVAAGPGAAAATIQPNAVTNAKLADMATARFKGRTTAGTGDPEDLTGTQATAMLDLVNSTTKGLAPLSGGGTTNFLRADGTWATPPGTSGSAITSLTSDVTATGPGAAAATIAADAVTNAKAANMANATIKARITAGTGDPEDATGTQVTTLLDTFTSSLKGLATPSGGGTANYLRADGTWVAPPGTGGITSLTGDVTGTGPGATATTIANDAVTFAKMQNIPTQTLLGRQTAATGDPESIGVTGGVEFDGSGNIRVGAFTGDVIKSAGSAGTAIAANAVTNAQLAQVPTGTLKGRTAAGTGNTSDLTFAAVKAALAIVFADVTGTLQAAQFPALTGDVTTVAGSLATTLAASGVTAGSYGDGSHVAAITVDAKGRVTAASAPSISITAGAVSGLSTTQTGALTGDVTKPAGSGVTTLANIPNDTTVPGDILGVTSTAPATPAAGRGRLWFDNTDSIWKNKDESGNVTHMTRAQASVAHQFVTAINADGSVGIGQPVAGDLAAIAANTTLANPTGGSAAPIAATVAQMRTMLGFDVPQSFELNFSWGCTDGSTTDSLLPRTVIGNWVFFMNPNMLPFMAHHAYAPPGAIDANVQLDSVLEWFPGATFGHCEILVGCFAWDPQSSVGSPSIQVVVTKNGLKDASPCSATMTGVGLFTSGGAVSYSIGPTDRTGIIVFPNADFGNNGSAGGRAKFTVKVRWTI